jgi:hypothetical protein
METATKDAIELRNAQGDTPVHKVRSDRRRRNQERWFVIVVMELTI